MENMDVRRLIFLLGWFEGSWRAVPVLQSRDVSCTSRWQSPGELPYLTDKDYSPLGGICVLNHSFLGFLKGKRKIKELSSTIQWNLVTFNLKSASSLTQTGFCHLTKMALLCNLSVPYPQGLSWEMEAFYELQERIGNCVFPAYIVRWVLSDCTYGVLIL